MELFSVGSFRRHGFPISFVHRGRWMMRLKMVVIAAGPQAHSKPYRLVVTSPLLSHRLGKTQTPKRWIRLSAVAVML